LTVSGAATLAAAALGFSCTPSVAADLVLAGATTVTGQVGVKCGSIVENKGTMTLQDSTGFNAGGTTDQILNDSGATITYTATSSTKSVSVNAPFTNNGTVACNAGTLILVTLTNLSSSGTFSGGTYTTAWGVISLPHSVSTNGATITLGASPSAFTSGGTNALTVLQTNTGSLELKQSLSLSGALANSGTVALDAGTLQATGYTQTAGKTTVVGGATLEAGSGTGNVTISSGTLTGTGQVEGNLLGAGTVTPAGMVAGPMMVSGTYNDSNGTLMIPVSGTTTPGIDYGQLAVAGAATLGGTLTLATANGFLPPIGTQYTLLNARVRHVRDGQGSATG
jgi:hypothetical protein